jgi:hypothetical protein
VPIFESFFEWLQTTPLATSVAESLLITAWLSAIHLIGFTLIMGGALVANLRLFGVLLPQRAVLEIAGPASRVIALGLAVSIVTGLLLFSGRAATVIANGTFQLKMLLLVAAVLFHFTLHARLARRPEAGTRALRATAAFGLSLWIGLALAACAFILFE